MYIKVRVTPNAKKEKLHKLSENYFEIAVKEKAERNMANKRIREIIAQHFDIALGSVRIASGHHSPVKILDIST